MGGRLAGGCRGEPREEPGCSLSAVSEVRADRLAPRGPDPSGGASASDSSRTSLLMLQSGRGGQGAGAQGRQAAVSERSRGRVCP